MEKIGTIDVFFAPEREGTSRSNWDSDTRRGRITLVPNNVHFPITSKSDLADVFAHELGHMIGSILRLPAQEDGQMDNFIHNILGGPSTKKIYDAEVAAWDLASKMRTIDPRNRDPRLKSYRENME